MGRGLSYVCVPIAYQLHAMSGTFYGFADERASRSKLGVPPPADNQMTKTWFAQTR
jgi:hypothetical protein